MKPRLPERVEDVLFNLKEFLGYQALYQTVDNVELQYVEDTVELLEELYDLLK